VEFVRTLRWFVYLLLALIAAGGAGAYWLFTRSDELLKQELLSQLQTMFPGTDIDLDRAHFDLSGRVRAYQVRLTLPGDDFASLTIAELVIKLDRDQLAESQDLQVERIRLIKPRAWIVRRADQTWNWQQLQVQRTPGGLLPDVEIEHGTATVQFEQPRPEAPLDINCTELRLTATPSSDRSWAVALSSRVDGAGPVRIDGDFHLDGAPWKAGVAIDGLVIDQSLIGKIVTIRPEWRQLLEQQQMRLLNLAQGKLQRPDVASRQPPGLISQNSGVGELGVRLVTNVQARISRAEPGAAPKFQIMAEIRDGRLTNKLLPLPMDGVTGKFYADASQVVLQELRGRHGESTITCSAKWETGKSPALTVKAREIVIDDMLTARLPESLQRLIRLLSLRGQCDLDAQLTRTEQGYLPDVELTLRDGSVNYEKFRYPVRDVTGKLSWHGDQAHLEGRGNAGSAPVVVTGTITKPGPGAEMVILLKADDVPIDAALLQASPAAVRMAAQALELRGSADAWVKLIKPAGVGAKAEAHLVTRLKDCSVHYQRFPLRVDRINGLVRWNGEVAKFESLSGKHADAVVTCSGTYSKQPDNGKLMARLRFSDAPFDADLLAALPARLQDAWHEFRPTGRFDAEAEVVWVPGGEFELKLPDIKLKNAGVTLRSFPFPWHDVTAEMSYEHDRLTVHALQAEHDDCRLRAKGAGVFPADRPWQFRFTELFVDDLPTTPALRRALPSDLRTVVDALNPTGTISVRGPIAFYGPNEDRDAIRLEWNSDIFLSGSNLTLGQRIENIYGRVTLQGSWDGETTEIRRGELDLDSLEIFGHQLTEVRGPFQYQQGEITAGSRPATIGPVMQAAENVPLADQISAKAIDGTLTMNAMVQFVPECQYRLRLLMIGGNLERYAKSYLQGQNNIRGNINGWLDLQGQGEDAESLTGSGRMVIRPAELYDAPVFVQMFQVLGPQFQERSAFQEATLLFTVGNQRFNFQEIDLVGNAIRLRGRGYVRFDRVVKLEFYSMLARNQIRVPLVSDVIGLLSRGWYGVSVSGDISDPQVKLRAIPELDDSLQQFLGALEPRPMRPTPRTFIPRTGQSPSSERR